MATFHPAITDVGAFQGIPQVETILRLVAKATGQRTAVVARLDGDAWTACAVLDEAGFGMVPGTKSRLELTY